MEHGSPYLLKSRKGSEKNDWVTRERIPDDSSPEQTTERKKRERDRRVRAQKTQ
jgi:hypothetical protein